MLLKKSSMNLPEIRFKSSRRCAPLRAGICGVSGIIVGSTGWKIFFHFLPNLNINHWEIRFKPSRRCALLRAGICRVSERIVGSAG
jgi:hypothetical protein